MFSVGFFCWVSLVIFFLFFYIHLIAGNYTSFSGFPPLVQEPWPILACGGSFSSKAQTESVWQWSKQLAAGISKHHWGGGYTVLTLTTHNGLNCVSEVIGLMGNSTKCAHWMTLVNVGMNFSQESRAVSYSSACTWCKVSSTGLGTVLSLKHYSH